MERRVNADRRKVHMFFDNDRRKGPHDRRGADMRREERARQIKKIKALTEFKEMEKKRPAKSPVITARQLVYVAVALLILVLAIALLTN
ncbi:hypothetical protein DESC_750021 [Desulfosarcina cetonica]|uniref:hypothetical protein n=1 Tax=Desulfosarcina cetonica TaxID=90730 RepID=UPI0006CFDEAD|nr:hypothetical protein [Desulfosarcina cetonica]VTR69556.1 hypothetical protein DESC_750021 [Desulfosarcina cetonica]